jgi:hypothetical protein
MDLLEALLLGFVVLAGVCCIAKMLSVVKRQSKLHIFTYLAEGHQLGDCSIRELKLSVGYRDYAQDGTLRLFIQDILEHEWRELVLCSTKEILAEWAIYGDWQTKVLARPNQTIFCELPRAKFYGEIVECELDSSRETGFSKLVIKARIF